jgi:hypothetical protein
MARVAGRVHSGHVLERPRIKDAPRRNCLAGTALFLAVAVRQEDRAYGRVIISSSRRSRFRLLRKLMELANSGVHL